MITRHFSLFHPARLQRHFHINQDVIKTSHEISEFYRVQEPQAFFTFGTMILGIYASVQLKTLEGSDIVKHQKNTRFVGATNKKEVAHQLEESWQRGSILTIDSKFLHGYTINVGETIKRYGTDFFTGINEHEHCMSVLPLCTIKSICFNNTNKIIRNPFYISSHKNKVVEEFKPVYLAHMHFLQTMFDSGSDMSMKMRQTEINKLVKMYCDFYDKYLPQNNPYRMTVSEFKNQFGEEYFGDELDYLPNKSINELVLQQGDNHFNNCPRYRHLLIKKKIEKYHDEAYERRSYQFE